MQDNAPQEGWTYNPDDQPDAEKGKNFQPISWTASEYIGHQKGTGWYLLFVLGLVFVAGAIYFITGDVFSAGVIVFAGLLFIMIASRKPREIAYAVNEQGVSVGAKPYPYTMFKSFSVADEGAIRAINLMPLKRFMPELSIYFPPEEESKIINILSEHLPHEEHVEHSIDKLFKKIRF